MYFIILIDMFICLQSFIESLSAKSDAYVKHWMAQFILLIATRFIDKKLVFNEKIAVVPANTTKRRLDLLSKYRDIVIESLLGTSLYMVNILTFIILSTNIVLFNSLPMV
jgi:hypothetical protein